MPTIELVAPIAGCIEFDPHVICPMCPTVFICTEGWIHHMKVDHWWELDDCDLTEF
jgi:hypothetical protein